MALGAAAACVAPARPGPLSPLMETVRIGTRSGVVSLGLDEYVLGTALAEVAPVGESPAAVSRIFEIQAVVARTYAFAHVGRHKAEGFDLCDTTHCQLYEAARVRTSRFAAVARAAVRRTRGQVLTYGRRPADALYHADCGGHTAAADAVWGGPPVPYLISAPDTAPALTHRTWQVAMPGERARAALNADGRSAVGARLDAMVVVARDASGRAVDVRVVGTTSRVLRAGDWRAILNRALGAGGIQSTRVDIARDGGAFVVRGSGFGHGVGLCQRGAAARARLGEDLETILDVYFKGARLVRM